MILCSFISSIVNSAISSSSLKILVKYWASSGLKNARFPFSKPPMVVTGVA